MEALVKKRNVAIERLKREHAGARQLVEQETPMFEVNDRLQKLAEMEENFDKIQCEIEETATEDELSSVLNVRTDYEKLFYTIKGFYTRLLQQTSQEERSRCGSSDATFIEPESGLKEAVRVLLETQRALLTRQAAASTTVEELAVQFRVKQAEPIDTQLPSFSLPMFKGDRKQWASFKDIFTSSVHKKNLTNALKLQLLMAHLEGEAKSLVSNYAITDVNYKQVWDTLVEQYDKPKFAVSALVQEFCDQPVIKAANLVNLRKLVSTSDEVIRQLKAMGAAYETRDPWLNHLILRKLDDNLRSQWATHIVDIDNPTFDELLKFLKRRCDAFETCAAFGGKQTEFIKKEIFKEERKNFPMKKDIKSFNVVQQQTCLMCSENHAIYHCTAFKEASVKERRDFAQQTRLCFNCLRSNHCAKVCPSKSVCRTPDCKQRHHTLLCQSGKFELCTNTSTTETQSSSSSTPMNAEAVDNNQVVSCSTNVKTSKTPLVIGTLPTAVVRVKGNNDQFYEVRAMIDCGSQASLITEHCVTVLGLKRKNANLVVTGISSSASETTKGVVDLEISSRFDFKSVIQTKAYVLSKLTKNLPNQKINMSRIKCLESLLLADPDFDKPSKIDIILGVDVFLSIVEDGKVKDGMGVPVALNSAFGWIVAGQVGEVTNVGCNSAIISLNLEINIDKTLRQFWEVEEINKPKPLTTEEQKAVDMFHTTYQREESGRFVVSLPFDETKPPLGESLPAAIQRLKAMERKFASDPDFKKMYCDFMAEYLALGHMERIPDEEIGIPPDQRFYFPHHAVMRNDSLSTKLRVVFDGSCKTSTGVSLNDRLLVGPKVTEDVPVVFTRFRTYAVAFKADAEKMYRQIKVHKKDINYQRVVWISGPGQTIEHYRLLTVTYGSSCAPYLAVESLRQAARDCQSQYPDAAERVLKNFYIDDLLSGADSFEDAEKLRNEIIQITSAAGFNLRKWSSNNPRLFDECEAEEAVPLHLLPEAESVKALGISWYPEMDAFGFQLNVDFDKRNTKRQMSDTARLFDPLGWIAPVIVRIKILYQSLWLQDLLWDDPLPAAIDDEWSKIKTSLKEIEKIRIPRWIANHGGGVQLLGFADASEAAYVAVVYARSTNKEGNVFVSLVASKTKVAPIQQVSLPRLELNAAVLLTELMKQILQSFTHLNVTCYAWTDSKIVLGWLSSHPKKWKTYVANRTSTILEFLPRSSWSHVHSDDNPADCASRGLYPEELVKHKLWWKGPSWLYNNEDAKKHIPSPVVPEKQLLEQVVSVQCSIAAVSVPVSTYNIESYILDRFSSLTVAQRVLAWVNRFRNNIVARRRGGKRICGALGPSEILKANMQYAQCAQQKVFGQDIERLRRGEQLAPKSRVKSLFPFLDGNGTLRVGGRLQNSEQPYDMKHPVILPKSHRYTNLLVTSSHIQNMHAGPTLLIATLNQRYWILGCQTVVRSVVNSCVRCVRWKAKTAKQLMGSLPTVRTVGVRAFENVGVDYAGPIIVKASMLRTTKTIKGYIAVFVCLGTKATHLEAVTDLSSNAFISALKRFCSRRGLPSQMWSDNGTNFVGADRQLKELLQSASFSSEVDYYLSSLGIKWNFITPSAPHMGGIWEGAVKSMKKHLRAVLGTETLSYEDLTTVLTQVEACLNSRPLCALSSSIDSCEALTPGHFVIGQPINLVPEPDVSHIPENRLDKYQRLRKITAMFWDRFKNEYVSSLQPRNKWQKTQENLKVGDLVLVKNDNTPPAYWELARVTVVHPDRSGVVRNVTLQRSQTTYQRPVHKLVVLPSN